MRLVLLLALLAGGCMPDTHSPFMYLIDQRSFAPGGVFGGAAIEGIAPKPEEVKNLPPLPLLILRFTSPDDRFDPAIASAVEAAQSRKPDVAFNVIAIVPGGDPSSEPAQDAAAVARAIAEQSVPPERIHIGVLEDTKATGREVRVYVR